MKSEKFKVIQFIREFIVVIDKYMVNFPKSEIELKNRIRTNTYDILEMAYEANMVEDIGQKRLILWKILAKIKVIDFLLNMSYDKGIIPEKKYYKFGNRLDNITKYTNGWLKSTNKDGSKK